MLAAKFSLDEFLNAKHDDCIVRARACVLRYEAMKVMPFDGHGLQKRNVETKPQFGL